MTTSELLTEIRKLPIVERKNLIQNLSKDLQSEDEVDRLLMKKGIMKEIPLGLTDEEDEFEPIDFGTSLADIIIEDRR